MSELKAFNSERIYWAVEQVERVAGDIDTLHLDDNLFCIKSEVDKEIDFWEKESHEHYERWFNLNKQYEGWLGKVMRCERAERELSHQKYKRCLAMARIAQDDWHLHNSFYAMGHQEFEKRKCEFYEKWRQRWLNLSEKFKPNSTTAPIGQRKTK